MRHGGGEKRKRRHLDPISLHIGKEFTKLAHVLNEE
jgi:hypothetical protein